jgi:hypothetical protein
MEIMQWSFPHMRGVWQFKSEKVLTSRGLNVAVDKWHNNTPIVDGILGVRDFTVPEVDDTVAVVTPEKSGGSVSYYSARITAPTSGKDAYTAECNDIIEALGMNYAEGNAFKAIWRSCAARTLGKLKDGGDAVYDAEKVVFFGKRMLAQRKGGTK